MTTTLKTEWQNTQNKTMSSVKSHTVRHVGENRKKQQAQ